jgi:hypothetical protein
MVIFKLFILFLFLLIKILKLEPENKINISFSREGFSLKNNEKIKINRTFLCSDNKKLSLDYLSSNKGIKNDILLERNINKKNSKLLNFPLNDINTTSNSNSSSSFKIDFFNVK